VIAAGYMSKRIEPCPEALGMPTVSEIYSLSGCISENFADYINCWKHNGYWLFDSPAGIEAVAKDLGVSLSGTTLLFYEVYEREYDQEREEWLSFAPEQSFPTRVVPPTESTLEGYDVVSFFVRSSPECSPLSCNGLGSALPVNARCLLPSLESAIQLVSSGAFKDCEPGPLRVFAVRSAPRVAP
jgi:hypothetical protein